MVGYRFLAHDLRTNTPLEELPLDPFSITEQLNTAGSWSAALPLTGYSDSGEPLAPIYTAASIPERTAIYVEREGVIIGGGIIWKRTRAMGGSAQLAGAGFWSFFRRRHLRTLKTYTATDQLAITRDLITAAQAATGANIGVTVGAETSGVLRDRTYQPWEAKQIGEAVEQLAAVANGFDFSVDVNQDLTKTFRLHYPRRGRLAGSTGVVFATGKNVLDWSVDEDGSSSAREFTAIGTGDGVATLVATRTRTDLIDVGFPLTSDVGTWKDVSVAATLAEHAQRNVDMRAPTPLFWRIRVAPSDPDGGIGTWIVGDDVLLEVTDDLSFPAGSDGSPGYRALHRIVQSQMNIRDGDEELWVTLGTGTPLLPGTPAADRRNVERRLLALEARP